MIHAFRCTNNGYMEQGHIVLAPAAHNARLHRTWHWLSPAWHAMRRDDICQQLQILQAQTAPVVEQMHLYGASWRCKTMLTLIVCRVCCSPPCCSDLGELCIAFTVRG